MSSENFEFKKPEIRAGKGGELSEAFRDRLLLFGKVKNNVAFVNNSPYADYSSGKDDSPHREVLDFAIATLEQ